MPKKQKGMTSAGRIYCKFVVKHETGNDILNFITWKNGKGMEINLKTVSKILLETKFSLKVLTFQLSNVTELEVPKYA